MGKESDFVTLQIMKNAKIRPALLSGRWRMKWNNRLRALFQNHELKEVYATGLPVINVGKCCSSIIILIAKCTPPKSIRSYTVRSA